MFQRKQLGESVIMVLLQFLEGPKLTAVQSYEPLPNGLRKGTEDPGGPIWPTLLSCKSLQVIKWTYSCTLTQHRLRIIL